VHARFPGAITSVQARQGEPVAEGQLLAQVESNESLKIYDLRSPINGVVIEHRTSVGEIAGDQPLFTIADLTTLWAELQVFPGQRSAVAPNQKVHLSAEGLDRLATISHLLPSLNNASTTLARVEVDN